MQSEKQGLKTAHKLVKDCEAGIVSKANEASKALESHTKIVSECTAKEQLFNNLVLLSYSQFISFIPFNFTSSW